MRPFVMNLSQHPTLRLIAPVLGVVIGFVLQANATLTRGPMLQGATSTNLYILAECTTTASVTVNFGTTASYGSSASTSTTRASNGGSTYVHAIKLTGLQPNTVYHYQLVAQGTTSADYTFTTLVNPGAPFRFAWAADFRTGTAVHNQISDRIRLNHTSPRAPLFDLSGGDYASDNTYANWTSQWLTGNELALERVMPVYLAPGNHDGWASGGNMQNFDQPPDSTGANGYYSFDCGDLHATVGNYQTTYSSGSAQWNWIRQDVTNSLKPWKIFAFHAPAYTYGGAGAHAGDTTMQSLSTSVLQPNGVKVFFAGHNHFYQRNLINGLHHITCGGAGAPLYPVSTGSGTVVSISDNCYMICDVTATNLHMVAYNNVGTVLDTIDLYKPAAPTGLAATPGNGQATLVWDAVTGATSYTVYYGTADGGPYPSKEISAATSTTVTSLDNGTTYYFAVSAIDPNGPSAISAQVSATPTNPPVSPLISSCGVLSDGSFSLGGTATVGQICILLGASNLAPPIDWTPIATNTADNGGAFSLSDPQATNYQQRFYRIWTP